MPEQKPLSFSEISEDFNATAGKFLLSPDSIEMLLTKYSALQAFRLTEQDDRQQLAATLFDTCEKFLAIKAKEGKFPSIGESYLNAAEKLLAVIAEPENALLLPRRAPEVLAGFALAFVKKSETVTPENFSYASEYYEYKRALTSLAPKVLKYAKDIKAVADLETEKMSTGKNFSVPRPLVLKKSDKDRAP